MNGRYSKLDFLLRVKVRKTPSLSAQASFAPFSLKVAWSGKSLISIGSKRGNPQVCPTKLVFTPFSLKVAWSGKSLIG